jgi:hypothetical protein
MRETSCCNANCHQGRDCPAREDLDGPSAVYSLLWFVGVFVLALMAAALVIGAPWLASLLTPLLKGFL